jgi:PKD domain
MKVLFAVCIAMLGQAFATTAYATNGKVLILDSTVSGGLSSPEALAASAAGETVDVVTGAQWDAMTTAEFAAYDAIILGDPDCTGDTSPIAAAEANAATWNAAIGGKVIIIGTDPTFHTFLGNTGAQQLITSGVAFAVSDKGQTGAYIDLSCYYYSSGAGTAVPMLANLSPYGGFTVFGQTLFSSCPASSHIVATSPALAGLTDADLSNWGCSTHEAFDNWPADFEVLAINSDIGTNYTASDGSVGGPYILSRGATVISNISLTPLTATNPTGTNHTVTATVTENGTPVAGTTVTFTVIAGPNTGVTGTGTTDSNGQATFTYSSTLTGTDLIHATYLDSSGRTETSNTVEKTWTQVTNTPPTPDAGGPYAGDEGSAISISGTATDPDAGDTVATAWSYSVVSADAGAACSFGDAAALSTTVTCTDNGTFTLTLSADDGVNPPVTSDATLTVANVDPVVSISAPLSGALNAVGSPVALTAPFSDAGTNDTHNCTIDWGDGSGAQAASVSETPGSGTCSGSLAYAAAGIYTIKVAVTDDNGGVGTASVDVIVYDPSAGFVTGGGWINSPVGAYVADPSLSGRANFGFVSRYKKGASVPDGNTEFQFQAGGLNFHSDSYQWLIVNQNGTNAQFKGTGTINGVGSYDFMIWAGDGSPDTFRIQITDPSNGDAVVYDNGVQQALGGGSIVIHTK